MHCAVTVTSTDLAVDGRAEDLAGMLAALRRVHRSGRTRDYDWRIGQLAAIKRFCAERESDIVAALESDLGRPPFEGWFGDVASTLCEVNFALKGLKRWMRPRRQRLALTQRPGSARIQYEPLGIVLVIGPWNYPVYLALSPVVAAIAAGNCVVIKPSELAPATSRLLAEVLPRYLDPDAIKVIEGDAAVTQELLALGFDHALFTGGTETGRKIMTGAASTLTPVTLELGGKSPVIVTRDCDLSVAARRIAWVKTMNSGQTCIAPDYVLVDEHVREALVAELCKAITAFVADRPDGMRIVDDRQMQRLVGYLQATRGEVVLGGGYDRETLRLAATIVVEPSRDEPLMTEEIFGPILPVIGYPTIDDAVDFVTARPKPLALYVFSRDRRVSDRVVDAIPAGGAVVNHCALHCLVPGLPFGGVGDSGMGAYHGEWGFQTMSHSKAVLAKPFKPDLQIMYPPYSDKAKALMRRLF